MTDIYYPHDSLPMPLQEGYGFQPVSPLKRTQLTTGRARQRRAYTSTPTQASITWLWKPMRRDWRLSPGSVMRYLTGLHGS